jgi:hypothetical protein
MVRIHNMTDKDLSRHWVEHFTAQDIHQGSVDELYELSKTDPERAWGVIKLVCQLPVNNSAWQATVDGALGCGPLENIIALFPDKVLDSILTEAKVNNRLRKQLNVIYDSDLPKETTQRINIG